MLAVISAIIYRVTCELYDPLLPHYQGLVLDVVSTNFDGAELHCLCVCAAYMLARNTDYHCGRLC